MSDFRAVIKDRRNHFYHEVRCVYGRKPRAGEEVAAVSRRAEGGEGAEAREGEGEGEDVGKGEEAGPAKEEVVVDGVDGVMG